MAQTQIPTLPTSTKLWYHLKKPQTKILEVTHPKTTLVWACLTTKFSRDSFLKSTSCDWTFEFLRFLVENFGISHWNVTMAFTKTDLIVGPPSPDHILYIFSWIFHCDFLILLAKGFRSSLSAIYKGRPNCWATLASHILHICSWIFLDFSLWFSCSTC